MRFENINHKFQSVMFWLPLERGIKITLRSVYTVSVGAWLKLDHASKLAAVLCFRCVTWLCIDKAFSAQFRLLLDSARRVFSCLALIDKNWVENQIGLITVGRKNWLFAAGSLHTGRHYTAVKSLVQSQPSSIDSICLSI